MCLVWGRPLQRGKLTLERDTVVRSTHLAHHDMATGPAGNTGSAVGMGATGRNQDHHGLGTDKHPSSRRRPSLWTCRSCVPRLVQASPFELQALPRALKCSIPPPCVWGTGVDVTAISSGGAAVVSGTSDSGGASDSCGAVFCLVLKEASVSGRALASVCGAGIGIAVVEVHGCDFFPCRVLSDTRVRALLIAWVMLALTDRHAWVCGRVRWTAAGADARRVCSARRPMASDGGRRAVCTSLALGGQALVRGRGGAEECAPFPHADVSSVRAELVTASVPGCGS
jgi:hypothetical protein